jgi:hypothetical protein
MDPDPDPGGPKTCGSGRSGSGSATLARSAVINLHGTEKKDAENMKVGNKQAEEQHVRKYACNAKAYMLKPPDVG